MTKYNKYNDLICRYYASHADIPPGDHDGETIGIIVRCKDCKNQVVSRFETPGKTFEFKYCAYCTASGVLGNDNDFCSFGSRK